MKKLYLFALFIIPLFLVGQEVGGYSVRGMAVATTSDTADHILIPNTKTGRFKKTKIYEGTYAPTAAGVTNITTITASTAYYQRLGFSVNVWGEVTINPANVKDTSEVTLTLPIASAVAATYEIGGIAQNNDSTAIRIYGDVAGNKAALIWFSRDTTSKTFSYYYNYKIK